MELVSLGMYKDKSKGYVFVVAQKVTSPAGDSSWQLFKIPNIQIPFMEELQKRAAEHAKAMEEAKTMAGEPQVTNYEPVNEETPIKDA